MLTLVIHAAATLPRRSQTRMHLILRNIGKTNQMEVMKDDLLVHPNPVSLVISARDGHSTHEVFFFFFSLGEAIKGKQG